MNTKVVYLLLSFVLFTTKLVLAQEAEFKIDTLILIDTLATSDQNYYGDFIEKKIIQGINLNDSTFVYHGTYKEYLKGILRAEGDYHLNQRTGVWKKYYDDGTLEAKATYLAGKPNGNWKYYYKSGQLASSIYFKAGEKYGTWIGFQISRDTAEITHYINDTVYTSKKTFGPKGALLDSVSIVNGVTHQYHTYYYKSGHIKSKYHLLNGEYDGAYETYYDENILESKANYDKGKLLTYEKYGKTSKQKICSANMENGTGSLKLTSENGKLLEIRNYKDGKLDGKYIRYNEKLLAESIDCEGQYQAGQRIGEWKYLEGDRIVSSVFYENDSNFIRNDFNKAGKKIFTVGVKNNLFHGRSFKYNIYG